MSPEEADFWQAIFDDPDDDAVRLVYADWLEEHGRANRAEFIRVQCELARLHADSTRNADLVARQRNLFPVEFDQFEGHFRFQNEHRYLAVDFHRGFIYRAHFSCGPFAFGWEPFLQQARLLLRFGPMEHFELDYHNFSFGSALRPPKLAGLLQLPEMQWVRRLNLPHIMSEAASSLTRSPNLHQIRELRVSVVGVSPQLAALLRAHFGTRIQLIKAMSHLTSDFDNSPAIP